MVQACDRLEDGSDTLSSDFCFRGVREMLSCLSHL